MDPNLKCCVLGCHTRRNQGLRFYQFPCHNPKICSIWEQRICQSANIDVDILNDHICELHFDYRCKTGNECALEEGSLPTLHLPGFGTLFSTGNAHFQMNNEIEEASYTISIDELSYHCRFCLRRGLLYEVETSTYRSKSFLSLIDLPLNVFPDNTEPNACLSCLKSIVIAHQLPLAVEHSNTILQQLLQHPKQCKVVSNNNFFDIKSELAFCNLIPANALAVKLEIEFKDNMVCPNEDYEQKCVATGEPSSAVYMNTQNMVENSICVTENQHNDNKMHDSITSEGKCSEEFHKSFEIGALGENTTDLTAEGIPNANWQTTFISDDKNTHFNENDGVYICRTCDWKTTSPYSFNAHLDKHVQIDSGTIETQELETLETGPVGNKDGRYQCTECSKAFKNKSHFNRHKLIHTNERPYKCTECLKTFIYKNSLDKHKRIHTNERLYKCTECSKTFIHKSSLDKHKKMHANEIPYKCTECSITFIDKSTLVLHKRTHTDEIRYKCTECPRTFSHSSNLSAHKKLHMNDRPYKCTECPKTFIHKIRLDTHKRIHTNERPFKCTECSKTFIHKSSLVIHKRTHTNEMRYRCNECPKTFRHKSSLVTHKNIHTNERPYKCTSCPKSFSQPGHLSAHMRIHTNERPYKCTKCPKTFTSRSNFTVHRKIHTNEGPYQCSECHKNFNYKGSLVTHKRIHTDERPYKCAECPKTFRRKNDVDTHKGTHTNERPYKCTECPKTFSRPFRLSVHKKIHSNERPYK